MKRLSLALLTLSLAIVGCSGSPTPSPTPIMCTPVLGGTPYECDKLDHDALKLQTAEYEEAENVYRRFIEEDIKQRASGHPTITPTLEETTMPEFRESMRKAYEEWNRDKVQVVSGKSRLVYVKRTVKDYQEGATRLIQACVDESQTRLKDNRGPMYSGRALKSDIYFTRNEGRLRIEGAVYSEVKTC